jgi:hypothetical protein
MEITSTAEHPFERCALDIVDPLTETTSRNKYILTFQDDLSKFLVADRTKGGNYNPLMR